MSSRRNSIKGASRSSKGVSRSASRSRSNSSSSSNSNSRGGIRSNNSNMNNSSRGMPPGSSFGNRPFNHGQNYHGDRFDHYDHHGHYDQHGGYGRYGGRRYYSRRGGSWVGGVVVLGFLGIWLVVNALGC